MYLAQQFFTRLEDAQEAGYCRLPLLHSRLPPPLYEVSSRMNLPRIEVAVGRLSKEMMDRCLVFPLQLTLLTAGLGLPNQCILLPLLHLHNYISLGVRSVDIARLRLSAARSQ
jgi:hypothetical protein